MARGNVVEYGRFLEKGGLTDCLICEKHVEPGHPRSGTFGLAQKTAPQLPVHLDCLNQRQVLDVLALYHRRLMDGGGLAERALPIRRELVH